MHPETRFKNRIRPKLEALPHTHVIKIQQSAIRGDPDFVLSIRGYSFYIELKRNRKEKPDPLQAWKLGRGQKSGNIAIVVSPETWNACYDYLLHFARSGRGRKGVPECLLKSPTAR